MRLSPSMLAIAFSDSINLGAVLLGLMILGAIAYFRIRSGVADVWENVAKAEKERSHQCQERLEEALKISGDQREQITRLEALPNLERVVNLMAEQSERAEQRAEIRTRAAVAQVEIWSQKHEERAMDRHDQQMELMREMQATQHEMAETFRKIGNGEH